MWLEHFTIIVEDYDRAIEFFTGALGFDLVEDSPSLTNDGRSKRWVVVRPPGARTGVLLAEADGPRQAEAVGNQVAGRVGFFLRVEDFEVGHRWCLSSCFGFSRLRSFLAGFLVGRLEAGTAVVARRSCPAFA